MRNGLDERQKMEMYQIGAVSFYLMFFASVAVIVAEVIWKGSFEVVAGEYIIFLVGGMASVAGCIKKGIWSKSGRDMTIPQSALLSVVITGVFTVFYVIALNQKMGGQADLAKHAVMFFVKISLVGFACIVILGKIAQRNRRKQEKKYSE